MTGRFGLAVLALATAGLLVPAIGAGACPDELDETCCLECCPLCCCCSHLPQVRADSTCERPGLGSEATVFAPLFVFPSPEPRDILHVPRSPASE